MKKLILFIALLNLLACCSSKEYETREERKRKSIERLDESEKNSEELFNEMEQ